MPGIALIPGTTPFTEDFNMRVLIIGAGNMGRGIATRFLAGGHQVTLNDIDRATADALATELGRHALISVAVTPEAAVAMNDVVVLASWYGANLDIARRLGPALAGKVVVDISNPLNDTYDNLSTPPGISAAETIRDVLPADAKLVKAFNTTFAATLVAGQVAGVPLDVYIAGDDSSAKDVVATLARSGGLNPIDVGELERARQLEGLALLGITLQGKLGTGFQSGWKLVLPKAA
jgi:predicted dinucleotide-binding enzyme